MNKSMLSIIILAISFFEAKAFCGFYVAKADTKIFNNTSQVILVRDGDKTIITMSNDFSGNVKDFAMVIPVPEVILKKNIRVADQSLFTKLESYSAPRLVDYYDQNPCQTYEREEVLFMPSSNADMSYTLTKESRKDKSYGVKIQAQYSVGEYDIIVLSAKQSNGLKKWLLDNGYKIPKDADEVLDPYIRSNMKFFVAKVNVNAYNKNEYNQLRPLQITMNSTKFMLPIRLGMANSKGAQDLIIYTLTKKGQVECTNYRTQKIPSEIDIPEFVQQDFGRFYKDLFKRKWKREAEQSVFLEYAWDISLSNYVKCDPCVSTPPDRRDLKEAGVWWIADEQNAYNEKLFFTRLHVRYARKTFPQDLMFQITPNNKNWQVRYILHHPATGNLSCSYAGAYIKEVNERRKNELKNLEKYTGWDISEYNDYPYTWNNQTYRAKAIRKGAWYSEMNIPLILLYIGLQIGLVYFAIQFHKGRLKSA
ncbi:MAG: DUF2330 domain-containing protein [Chitinophagaceae bacterium]